jgi:hypothetical protein
MTRELLMKRLIMTYEEAVQRHPGCYIDLQYVRIDETYPDFENVPVGFVPAIFVWPDRVCASRAVETERIAFYWRRDEF